MLTPITFPFISNNGPPLFPGFIDASCWINVAASPVNFLSLYETTPNDTVPKNVYPFELPTATTKSPSLIDWLSPSSKTKYSSLDLNATIAKS